MRRGSASLGIVLPVTVFLLALFAGPAAAEQGVYEFPEVEPTLILGGGYRLVDTSGSSTRAGEYEYLRDSIVLGGRYIAFPFPHRLHLEADALNRKDYFVDANYAYKDVVITRWVGRSLNHNLENFLLKDADTGTPSPGVAVRDLGRPYSVRSELNDVFLRFKTHHYPFHVYAKAKMVDKKGTIQERFLGGSGWFNDLQRTTQPRNVDWQTSDVTFGANSHLGPVEVDVSHSQMRFDSDGNLLSSEAYTAGAVRGAGTFPHSMTPDLEGSTTTLKAHTSYTGRIVASMTLSKTDRENEISGAQGDYFTGAGDLMITPAARVVLAFKYRHREEDLDNPDSLPAGYLGFSDYVSPITGIKPSMSSRTDMYSGEARVSLTRRVLFNMGYAYQETNRTDSDGRTLEIPGKTIENSYYVSAKVRLPQRLKLRAKLEHADTNNPAYNALPERADSGALSLYWTPAAWMRTYVSYKLMLQRRSGTSFEGGGAGDRDAVKNKFSGRLTFLLNKKASLTAGYTYLNNNVKQDVIYGSVLESDAHYKNRARNYVASVNYAATDKLTLAGGVSYTKSNGLVTPDTVSVASLSQLNTRETQYDLWAQYRVSRGVSVGLEYRYMVYENLHEDPNNPVELDGRAQVVLLSLSKKW